MPASSGLRSYWRAQMTEILPSFLAETAPLEPEHLPLQLALLTMEVAQLRLIVAALAAQLGQPGPASVPDYGIL